MLSLHLNIQISYGYARRQLAPDQSCYCYLTKWFHSKGLSSGVKDVTLGRVLKLESGLSRGA